MYRLQARILIVVYLIIEILLQNPNEIFENIMSTSRPLRKINLVEELIEKTNITELFNFKMRVIADLQRRAVKKDSSVSIFEGSEEFTTYFSFRSFLSLKKKLGPEPRLKGPELFFPDHYVDNLKALPINGTAPIPWSGYYWALRYGGIALRYSFDDKNTMYTIKNNTVDIFYSYSESISKYSQPLEDTLIRSNQSYYESYVNKYYSAAEKYDILVGDTNFTLTNYAKMYGHKFMKSNGDFAAWMGYCQGWAAASIMEKRIKKSVALKAADNVTNITFLPDDIEAFATIFWSNAKFRIFFVGNRCSNTSYCYSINPGVFFIIIANQIGIRHKNLIFEPKVDAEIWNQPAYSYNIQFYNILTDKYGTMQASRVTSQKLKNSTNPFLIKLFKKRKPTTKYFIGIKLSINYVEEDYPFHGDMLFDDTTGETSYCFVLELTESFRIIEGTWAQKDIPTFVWAPDGKVQPYGPFDKYVRSFTGKAKEIQKLKKYAVDTSKKVLVLRSILKFLLDNSAG